MLLSLIRAPEGERVQYPLTLSPVNWARKQSDNCSRDAETEEETENAKQMDVLCDRASRLDALRLQSGLGG
jgi:hypothetical protein